MQVVIDEIPMRWAINSEDVVTEEVTADPISYPVIQETLRIVLLPIETAIPLPADSPPTYKRVWTIRSVDEEGPILYQWDDFFDGEDTQSITDPKLWVKLDIMFTGRHWHQETSIVDEYGPVSVESETVPV